MMRLFSNRSLQSQTYPFSANRLVSIQLHKSAKNLSQIATDNISTVAMAYDVRHPHHFLDRDLTSIKRIEKNYIHTYLLNRLLLAKANKNFGLKTFLVLVKFSIHPFLVLLIKLLTLDQFFYFTAKLKTLFFVIV